MRYQSTIVACLLLLQSIGLGVRCTCEAIETAPVAPSVAAEAPADHSCCHGASEARKQAESSAPLRAAVNRRCADVCQCGDALATAIVESATAAEQLASLSTWQASQLFASACAVPAAICAPAPAWRALQWSLSDPPVVAGSTSRQLATLQRWRC